MYFSRYAWEVSASCRGLHPFADLGLVAAVAVAHLARMRSKWGVHHRVDQVVGDDGTVRLAADDLFVDDFLGADDQGLGSPGQLSGKAADAVDLGIPVAIGAVDVDQAHIQDERRNQAEGERR